MLLHTSNSLASYWQWRMLKLRTQRKVFKWLTNVLINTVDLRRGIAIEVSCTWSFNNINWLKAISFTPWNSTLSPSSVEWAWETVIINSINISLHLNTMTNHFNTSMLSLFLTLETSTWKKAFVTLNSKCGTKRYTH